MSRRVTDKCHPVISKACQGIPCTSEPSTAMQALMTVDERYCNRVKDTLALLYLKEGLEVFVDQQSNAFHHQLKAAMGAHTCTCTWQALTRGKRTWEVKHCPSGTCHSWLGLILSHHSNRSFPHLTPENTDPALWPTDYWEVMKVYQPRVCRDQHSAKEADVAGIQTTLNECDHFWTFITKLNDVNDLRTNKLGLSLKRELELKTIRAKQVVMKTRMENLGQAIKDLGAETVADLGTVKAKLAADVQTLQQQLDSQLSLIKDVQKDITTQQQASTDVHNSLTHIQQQLDALEAYLEKCKTDVAFIADMKQHLADLKLSSRQQEGRIDTLYQIQQITNTWLGAQIEEVQELKKQLQTHTSELQAHHGQLQTQRAGLKDHDEKILTCQTELQSHSNELVKHQSELQAHGTKLEDQDTRLLSCQAELQEQKEDLRSHRQKLTNLEERIETSKADNTFTEITEADVVDLRTSLIKRYRQHYLKVPNPVVAEEIGMKKYMFAQILKS